MDPKMTRREALLAAGLTPTLALAAPALLTLGGAASAATPSAAPESLAHGFKLGDFTVTALMAGRSESTEPQGTFGMNVPPEDFARVSAENFIPHDRTMSGYIPVLVQTGTETVLFDTGVSQAELLLALAQAGVGPDDVTLVVLTHMHGDHIGGLSGANGPTFAKARYVTGAVEYDHWAKAGNEGFDKHVRPLAEKMTMLEDGGAALPGITARLAPGHTPGHMAYHLESAGKRLMITADTANHYVWSLAYPDWEVRYDRDKAQAAATRRKIFGEIAADRIPFIGYHMPYPGVGFVAVEGEGFRYVPATYQFLLA